ncbi:MAG: NAD-dependent epimerase/dehydratase family protein [Halioglobus sp.]
MKCLVTGATGFIGRQLCEQLAACGHTVVALSKNGQSLENGQPTQALDLSEHEPDDTVLQDVDVCFHLAGIAHRQAQESDYQALNTRATLRLARMAAAAGVRSFIFLSSVKAMGVPLSSRERSECDTVTPVDAYGLSKWQAECGLRDQFSGVGMAVVIVRPVLVYGAGVKGNLQSLATAARLGIPRPPQGGQRSMIALDDLVALLLVIAQQTTSGVHTWIACSEERYSTRDIYDLLRTIQGKRPGVGWLPRWGWRAAAFALDWVSRRFDDSTYEKLFGTELYSNAAVLAATTWRPKVRLEHVIEHIASGSADQ